MRIRNIVPLDRHMREIVHGASITLGIRLVTGVLIFGLNIVVARTLGAHGAGLFFLALTVITIAGVLGRLGLDAAVVRFVASAAVSGRWDRVKGVGRHAILVTLGASLILAAAVTLSAGWMAESVFRKPDLTAPLMWMSLAIVPFALHQLGAQLLKGLKRIFFSQITLAILPAAAIPAVLLFGRRYGTPGAAAGYAAAAGFAVLVSLFLWRAALHGRSGQAVLEQRSELMDAARPLFALAALNLVMSWSASFLVGVWRPASDVALYNVAHRTAFLTTLMLTSVNSIAAPKFAELYHTRDLEALGATARNSARMMVVLALPVLLTFVLVPGFVMGLFGPEFEVGASVLVILALGQFVNVSTGSVGFVLIMTGRERMARNNAAVAAGVNIVLQVLLIPRFGAVGAAIATAVSVALLNLTAAYLVHRSLGIWTLPVRLQRHE